MIELFAGILSTAFLAGGALALAALGENLGTGDAVASAPAVMAIAAHDTDRVSLRRLTPAGFLIANFADREATGCHS